MRFRVFEYAFPTDGVLTDLNAFLASHAIASVRSEVVSRPSGALLVFIVEYRQACKSEDAKSSSRVDYREELTEEDFGIYERLRGWRKGVAEEEGVAVYQVFTNAQLAKIVQEKPQSHEELKALNGIGPSRVEKYGPGIVSMLDRSRKGNEA